MKMNTEINTNEANKAAVRRLYDECLNQGVFNAADDIIAPGFIAPGPDGGAGAEGFKSTAMLLRTAFPDIQFTIHDLIAENDTVALHWAWIGTHCGTFASIPATHKRVRQEGMVMYHLNAGKVVTAKLIFDRLGVFQQLDAMPELAGVPMAVSHPIPS